MSVSADILARAMALSESERAELARQLLLSLESDDYDADADVLWAKEIDARLEAMDRGEATPLDWRPAIERIRQSIRKDHRK